MAVDGSNQDQVVTKETVYNRGVDCYFKPRCRYPHPEGGNDEYDGEQRSRRKKIGGMKECRTGTKCRWKPLCLFLHPEGGNDHETAQRNFSLISADKADVHYCR